MKITVIAGIIPFRTHGEQGVTAAHLVSSALIREFTKQGHQVSLLCLMHQSRDGTLTTVEKSELDILKNEGVQILDPIFLKDTYRSSPVSLRSIRMLFSSDAAMRHFYPGLSAEKIVHQTLRSINPDIVFPIWAPQAVAATYRYADAPVIPYHGDIDFDPMLCRLVRDRSLFISNATPLSIIDGWLRLFSHRRAHLRMMRGTSGIANNAASNAKYYQKRGYAHSEYVGSLWPHIDNSSHQPQTFSTPRKIIGHVGYLNRTGSTYGLQFLLQEVVPHLQQHMKDPYEVHIIGGGEPAESLKSLLAQPNIIRHGFVDDLDAFLEDADVVCLFNNAAPYLAAYTRHMMAFASSQCLVLHARSKMAVPELVHEKNCLLAEDGKSAAQEIARACSDQEWNSSIRRGGHQLYEQSFTPQVTAKRIEELFQKVHPY